MFDPTEDKLDRDIDESMRMFEKALVPAGDPIQPRQPDRVLLALDGSSQDQAVVAAGHTLQKRFDAKIFVLDARDGENEAELQSINAATAIKGAELLSQTEGASYDQILAAVDSHNADLVIVPCPFGRDFEAIGADSAGTVIDVLVSRCPSAMLVVRNPAQKLESALREISLIVATECESEPLAAAWAFGLVASGGTVSLDVVTNQEQFENLKQILSVISPEKELEPGELSKALTDSHTQLHAQMQKLAFDAGIAYSLVPQADEMAPPVLGEDAKQLLIVLPLEVEDRFVQGFVHDRIRRSPHSVLLVPQDSDSLSDTE